MFVCMCLLKRESVCMCLYKCGGGVTTKSG